MHAMLLRVAYGRATYSHDPSTQNGAIIAWELPEGYSEVSWGYNHIPKMRGDTLEMCLADRDLKYPRVIHAETHAISQAAKLGKPTIGLTMVCPWAACLGCVGPILEAGIKRLVVHKQRLLNPYTNWNSGIIQAHDWLADAGIDLIMFDGHIPAAPEILVNYRVWSPGHRAF
jgi:deoxycytidylate deaminase